MSDVSWLAAELVALGARNVFGIPGEGASSDLLGEMERLGCRFHLVSHEAAGALMAGGYGRVSGVPGVSISIKGPGLSNMMAGIVANWFDHNPAISLSESYGPGSSPFRMHKRMAHAPMVANAVKAYADNPLPSLLSRLWDIASVEEPGPVHLDISARMTRTSFEEYTHVPNYASSLPVEAMRLIRNSNKPVIIAGALAARRQWREQLEQLKVPVFTTVAGKGGVDERLPYAAGIFTNSGGRFAPESKILPLADLIVGLGLRTTEILDVRQLAAPLIVLDELSNRAQGLCPMAEACVGIDVMLEALELLSSREWGAAELATARRDLETRLQPDRWLPAGALKLAQEMLPESTRFLLDTGNFCVAGEHILSARTPLSVMGSPCGRAMGVALPVAVGAALAARDIPLVTIVGDGGIGMYPEVIRVAVKEKLPLLILFMRDGFLSSVRREVVKRNGSGDFLRVDSPSWIGVFQGFGCSAEQVESFAGLGSALREWKADSGPLFLELVFDSQSYMTMTEDIR